MTDPQSYMRAMGLTLRYEHLTTPQRVRLCNGCGPKARWLPVPDFMFEASCDRHDFSYWLGATEDDRRIADYGFYLALCRDADRHAAPRRWWLRALAWSYYRAVRMFGGPCFHYAEAKRGWEDLAAGEESAS